MLGSLKKSSRAVFSFLTAFEDGCILPPIIIREIFLNGFQRQPNKNAFSYNFYHQLPNLELTLLKPYEFVSGYEVFLTCYCMDRYAPTS